MSPTTTPTAARRRSLGGTPSTHSSWPTRWRSSAPRWAPSASCTPASPPSTYLSARSTS
uniref:Uncharacterized protein n=1 Tax=Arundo donax TaxID=35708 RepID=A0A0A9AC72_ARUDO